MNVVQLDGRYDLCTVPDFEGQTSAPSLGTREVGCRSYGDVAPRIWDKVADYIENQVVVGNDGAVVATVVAGCAPADDLGQFVVVHDESSNRSYCRIISNVSVEVYSQTRSVGRRSGVRKRSARRRGDRHAI